MSDFISLIQEVLSIQLTIGSVTMSLGNVLLGTVIITYGVKFFAEIGDPRYNHSLGLGIDWSGVSGGAHWSDGIDFSNKKIDDTPNWDD